MRPRNHNKQNSSCIDKSLKLGKVVCKYARRLKNNMHTDKLKKEATQPHNIAENEYPILADGNCFFYCVILGYLLPVIDNITLFNQRVGILSNNHFSDADKASIHSQCSKYLSSRENNRVYQIFGTFTLSHERNFSLIGKLVTEIKRKINFNAAWAGEPEFYSISQHYPIELIVKLTDNTQHKYSSSTNNTSVMIRCCSPVPAEADLQGADAIMQSAIIASQASNKSDGKTASSHFRLVDFEKRIYFSHINSTLTQTVAGALFILAGKNNLTSKSQTQTQDLTKPPRSYDFIHESSSSTVQEHDTLKLIFSSFKAQISLYTQTTSKSEVIIELLKLIDSVSSRDNGFSAIFLYDSESLKIIMANHIQRCLYQSLSKGKFSQDEDFKLLCLYVELIIEHGWHNHLESLETTIRELLTKNAFPQKYNLLDYFIKTTIIAHMMIQCRFPRHELKTLIRLIQGENNDMIFQQQLHQFAFKLIINSKLQMKKHSQNLREPTHPPDDPKYFSSDFCECVGNFYIQYLGKSQREHWDIVNFPIFFYDLIHFERDNLLELSDLLQGFENTDFTTQQAIRNELVTSRSLSQLVIKMQNATFLSRRLNDLSLLYGEIFFTGAKNSIWADSCMDIGYLIIRYDDNWVCLYNTKTGYMTKETGVLFDAELLESSEKCLWFKILKRDGWHIFSTSDGLQTESWDRITLLYSGYYFCIKDKIAYIYDLKHSKILKTFTDVRAIQFIRQNPTLIIAIKTNNFWMIYDVHSHKYMKKMPKSIVRIERVPHSHIHYVLYDDKEICYLYNTNMQNCIPLVNMSKIHYESYSEVYVENQDGTFCSIKNLKRSANLSSPLFKMMQRYHDDIRTPSPELKSVGIFTPSDTMPVRYDYQMELQGTYHITKSKTQTELWLHNTVGGGRGVSLVKNADEIRLLGISRKISSNVKAYFLILKGSKTTLYTSYYTILKSMSDESENISSPPGDETDLHGSQVIYLYHNYFAVFITNQWVVFEEGYGAHQPIKADDIKPLDFKNFFKISIEGKWYLYDLSRRRVFSTRGANDIKKSADDKIVLIYDDHILYMSYQSLPSCDLALDIEGIKKEISSSPTLLQDNYLTNIVKQTEFSWPSPNNTPIFHKTLMLFVDYSFLRSMSPEFANKLAELFDGKRVDVSDLECEILKLNELSSYCFSASIDPSIDLKELIDKIKKNLRLLLKNLNHKMENIYRSFNVRTEVITALRNLPALQIQELSNALKRSYKNHAESLEQEYKKLMQNFSTIIETLLLKQKDGNHIVQLLKKHPHIMSSILRYWFSIDPSGDAIDDLYRRLVALTNLFVRFNEYECRNTTKIGDIILQKHYLELFKLYQFGEAIINNMIMAEYDLESIQDLLALLDNLQGSLTECAILRKAIEISPTLPSCIEKVESSQTREIELSRIDKITNLLRLLAIANELNNKSIHNINLSQFTKNSNSLDNLINQLAHLLREEFYTKLGLTIEKVENQTFDDQFLIDIMYTYENLKDENKTLLIIILKSILYRKDFLPVVTAEPTEESQKLFSKTENTLIQSLVTHNKSVRNAFLERNINWTTWLQGIAPMQGSHVTVGIWRREVAHDLFQGEYCNSCISLHKSNAKANLQYLSDLNFSMIEFTDNKSKKTIGHVTIWIATPKGSNRTYLVLNSIQIDRRAQQHSKEIWSLVFKYALAFSIEIGVQKVILGQSYNVNPPSILYEFEDAGQHQLKDDNKSKIKIDRKYRLKIIHTTLFKEFYSDAYFDGFIEAKHMENDNCQAWDISTFTQHAIKLVEMNPEIELQPKLNNYEIWIIDNGLLNDIFVQKDDLLIFIDKQFFEKDPNSALLKAIEHIEPATQITSSELSTINLDSL